MPRSSGYLLPETIMGESLSSSHPELAAEWHPRKNGLLRPQNITKSCRERVFWRCRVNPAHEWQATVMNRVYCTSACPRCEKGTLADWFPELAKQWHPRKNGELRPDNIAKSSPEKIWWQCEKDVEHLWKTSVKSRATSANAPTGCPFCDGQRASPKTSFAALCPDLVPMWHRAKNGDLTPFDVAPAGNSEVWWRCLKDKKHIWKGPVSRVTNSTSDSHGCPFCSSKQVCDTNSLSSQFPNLAREWHKTKNKKLTPHDVVAGSHEKVWWQCLQEESHVWKAPVGSRTRSRPAGCPYCAGKKVSETNSLATVRPDVAARWHRTKNGRLKPIHFTAQSAEVVWWQCPTEENHCWQAAVYSVVSSASTGCPYCAGKRVTASNSLAGSHPELAAEWHPTKNGSVTPEDVTAGTEQEAWWQCPRVKKHVYKAQMLRRKNGADCPVCFSPSETKDRNESIAIVMPKLYAYWHKEANKNVAPESLRPGSPRTVWWKCKTNRKHLFEATVLDMAKARAKCPFCSEDEEFIEQTLSASNPELAAQWDYKRNFPIRPEQVLSTRATDFWWNCEKEADHIWQSAPSTRLRCPGCPFCEGMRVAPSNSLETIEELAKQWHPKKNGAVTPRDVHRNSNDKAWWSCPKDPVVHVWQAVINARTSKGTGCPFCANRNVCDDNRLTLLFPEVAEQWHPTKNGKVKVTDIIAGSGKSYWWLCPVSKHHEWQCSVEARTKQRTGCPFCFGNRVAPDNCLATTDPLVAVLWHPTRNGKLQPSDVRPFSDKVVWWKCYSGHVWKAPVGAVVVARRDRLTNGCMKCYLLEKSPKSTNLRSRQKADRRIAKIDSDALQRD